MISPVGGYVARAFGAADMISLARANTTHILFTLFLYQIELISTNLASSAASDLFSRASHKY